MNTVDFLRQVLPSSGHYFLALPIASGGYKHKAYDTPEALAEAAIRVSNNGTNAFFALANYAEPEYIGDDGKKHWRTGDNAVSAHCFWMDIDCGGAYPTQKDAVLDLHRFVKEANIPYPNITVNSGNGVHVYWVMDRDVVKDQWRRVARDLKSIAQKLNFAQDDTTRTADISSVLRPIGTNNDKSHKGLGIKPVKLFGNFNETPVAFTEFVRAVTDTAASLGVVAKQDKPTALAGNLGDLIGGQEYPPASAVTIAEHCSQLRFMRDFKGAGQGENVWRACIGVLKLTIEGEQLAHEWSSGHEDYDYATTQQKIDNWKVEGATKCDTFRQVNPAGCAGCKHKCNSPISLGYVAPEHTDAIVHTAVDDEDGERIEHLPPLTNRMKRKFRFVDGTVQALTTNAQGVEAWRTMSDSIFVVDGYYRDMDDDGKYKLRVLTRNKPFEWFDSVLDARSIGAGGTVLTGDLASRAMVTTRDNKSMEEYMKTWLEEAKRGECEIAMYSHMGWQVDGSFVVGDMCYMPNGTSKQVILTDELRKMVAKLGFTPTGNVDRYRELIDFAYNRIGHVEYQFTYLTGYASPLIALLEPSPVGIVFSAWSNKSGKGKSSVAKLAGGIWHDPTTIVDAKGTTEFALYLNAGLRRNVPLVVDELTQWPPEKSGEFAYRYSSGMAKEQGAAAGGLRDNAHLNWSNSVTCTGNKSQHNLVKMYNQECGAQLARIFEYEFTAEHDQTMTAEEGYPVIGELMRMGAIGGRIFAKYITENREEIQKELNATYVKFMSAAKLSKDARFWVIGCASVWVAYQITKRLGLHSFEAAPLLQWIIQKLKAHDTGIKGAEVDYLAMFGDALADLHHGFLVTQDRGSKHASAKLAVGWQIPRGAITGRAVVGEGLLAVSVTQLTNWCRDNKVDKSQMISALEQVGWLVGKGKTIRLATGTAIAAPPVRAYEFDWNKFSGRIRLVSSDGASTSPSLSEAEVAA